MRYSILSNLVTNGANLTVKEGTTALHVAAVCFPYAPVAEAHGAIKFRDDYFKRIVQLFVQMGLDLNASNSEGITPLIYLCQKIKNFDFRSTIIEYMVDNGADVHATDSNGRTALHHMVSYKYTEPAGAIIKHGANVNVKEPTNGYTPLYVALVSRATVGMIQLLLKSGADVTMLSDDDKGCGAIYASIQKGGDTQNIRLLVDYGADINGSNLGSGWTALHLAASNNNYEDFVYELLECGADPTIQTSNGNETALDIARRKKKKISYSTISLLEECTPKILLPKKTSKRRKLS